MNIDTVEPYSIGIDQAKNLDQDELFNALRNNKLNFEAKTWAEVQPGIHALIRNYACVMFGG
jgi:hypothetical protein